MIAMKFNSIVKSAAKFSQENNLKVMSTSVTLTFLQLKKFQFFIHGLFCGFGEISIYFSQKFKKKISDLLNIMF